MADIFDNALDSIILGIEDLREGTDRRVLSAARNYYAGLLLLGKECLIRSAPEAEPMEVIGARFEPAPDGDGGVELRVVGFNTVDLGQLKARFKTFELPWPKADIDKLQRYRNHLEHYHLAEPIGSLREAIAASFPMLIDFFALLDEDPHEHLDDVWDTILETTGAFNKVQASCVESLEALAWPGPVRDLDKMKCPTCSSSLVGQVDKTNEVIDGAEGRCFQCGEHFSGEQLAEMVVANTYEIDAYLAAKNGEDSPIHYCPECTSATYVENGEVSACFYCLESVGGECARCGSAITVSEYDPDSPQLCGYCRHMSDKIMRE